jgi:hypothetical protein
VTEKAGASDDTWSVYIVCCVDGTLYTGITNDLSRRCEQHNTGTASRYSVVVASEGSEGRSVPLGVGIFWLG